jgi:hypothetical protein
MGKKILHSMKHPMVLAQLLENILERILNGCILQTKLNILGFLDLEGLSPLYGSNQFDQNLDQLI